MTMADNDASQGGADDIGGEHPGPFADEAGEVSVLLNRASKGELPPGELFEALYSRLRALAGSHMRAERDGHSLGPTVLVHEAWMRLGSQDNADWKGAAHFFGAAGEAMRRTLVDHARRRGTKKRGGGLTRLPLDGLELVRIDDGDAVLAVDEALVKLQDFDERLARVVRLRFWAGLDEAEVADLLDLSPRTVRRDWKLARAWLSRELERD